MNPLKYLCLAVLVLCSCNLESRKPSVPEMQSLEKTHADTAALILDSFAKLNIYIPPLYDKDAFDSTTVVKFVELAQKTEGALKLCVGARLVTNEIVHIISDNVTDGADLLLLIDKTGSMADDIDSIRIGLTRILGTLKKHNNVRLAIALYGDKNVDGPDWFSYQDFGQDYASAQAFIDQIEVSFGGDYPESVYDGFDEAYQRNFFRSGSKRMVILIGDAPPLEPPLSKLSVSDVIGIATRDGIKMNFYPIVVGGGAWDDEGNPKPVKEFTPDSLVSLLYPNPATDLVNINFAAAGDYTIETYNAAGTLISTDKAQGSSWQKNISALTPGPYILRIFGKDKRFDTRRMIVYR